MKLSYLSPSRRDLIKHLAAAGVFVTGGAKARGQDTAGGLGALRRGEEGYENARFNMTYKANVPDRFPDVIVKVESEADIYTALAFARANGLQVVCRTTGHNSAGAVLRNSGLLLDLSALTGVTIDAGNRTATVRAATTLQELVRALNREGLDFPIGTCDSVAVGGYLMGGGFGRNDNHYCQGPSCYALKSAEVILADGRKVTATEDENSDILWTLRGCGPGFYGVVVSYTIAVFEPTTALVMRSYTHAVKDLPMVRAFAERASRRLDDRIALNIGFSHDADGAQTVVTTITAASTAVQNPHDEARGLIDACASNGLSENAIEVGADTSVDLDADLYHFEKHMSTNTDNFYVDTLETLDVMRELHRQMPRAEGARITLSCTVNKFRHPMQDSACFTSAAPHMILHHVTWDAGELADRAGFEKAAHDWMGLFNDLLAPYGKGHFINQADNQRYPERIPASFSPDTWSKLKALRAKYDPDNLFFTYLGQA